MTKISFGWALAPLLLLTSCDESSNASPAGSAARTPASAARTPASASSGASGTTAVPGEKLVEVDLSSAGEDFVGLSIKGPGTPKLLKKPGDPTVEFPRTAGDPKAAQFMVTISHGKLPVDEMKEWVTDWAKGFSNPGKVTYVTDKAEELEYSVELKDEEGKSEMAYGYGVEVNVGGQTYACRAPNLEGQDLPVLKRVCASLSKK